MTLMRLSWWVLPVVLSAADLPSFDFTRAADREGWEPAHGIARLSATAEGLHVEIAGEDPYLVGPLRDYPVGRPLWLRLRLKSQEGGSGQVFFFPDVATETKSVRFEVPAGRWHEVQVPLPALGPGHRFRIDPPGMGGACWLARLWVESRRAYPAPSWPRPTGFEPGSGAVALDAGELRLVHTLGQWGGFRVEAAGELAATGHNRSLLGYLSGDEVRWVSMGGGGGVATVALAADEIRVTASWPDEDGGRWEARQRFHVVGAGAIGIETELSADRERDVLYAPMLMLLAGMGSHGTNKGQALLAGVEYLEDEPSSSEADVVGSAAWRLVPSDTKLTFPLMALQAGTHYVGLLWTPHVDVTAVHDSPDRQFGSGGHLMGLLCPGSDGLNREERSLMPYLPRRLRPGHTIALRAVLVGGAGTTVVPAVEQYVRLVGLPPPAAHGYSPGSYFELAARSWLGSRVREGSLFRHAWWPGFKPQPAADAALWMEWLASRLPHSAWGNDLTTLAGSAMQRVPPEARASAQIGHIRYPLAPLVYGGALGHARQVAAEGTRLLERFEPDGSVTYRPSSGGVDYGKTHWARDANGLTASVLLRVLEAAAWAGEPSLVESAVRQLRKLDKYRGGVPRGAQTWEIPLHTPDILAAAHLVRAYTLGYELTGDKDYLGEAKYWAWTGLPFVYLRTPAPGPVGVYGTIPVLGATSWEAPVWLGRPVQWCGLVYAEALYGLGPHDPAGPWRRIADGITATGLQHMWPETDKDRCGLLPDFYLMDMQQRDGPAINPATLLWPAVRLFRERPPYAFRAFRDFGALVHVPGSLEEVEESGESVCFRANPWSPRPGWIFVSGLSAEPVLELNGRPADLAGPHAFDREAKRLILQVKGPVEVRLRRTWPVH